MTVKIVDSHEATTIRMKGNSMINKDFTLGIDIGSTTVKVALLDAKKQLIFADYKRHFANIKETLTDLVIKAHEQLGNLLTHPVITGSGGLVS